jgi:hypothetical protein
MKKIALILMLCSATVLMAATTEHRTESVKARGQPEIQPMSYNFVVSEYVGSVEIAVLSAEVYATETPSLVAINENFESVPGITKGVRKVRDVDLCSKGEYTNTNTDKRSEIRNRTTRLARGYGSISCSLT